ncbi:unnamed protein product [Brassica oleracea]
MRWIKQTWVIATFLGKALTFFYLFGKEKPLLLQEFCLSESGTSLRFIHVFSIKGSGKTLEEEEASSLSLTQQDLLDSSGRFSVVNHGVCDANSVVEGERGEATEPSNSSDDRRNTSEVAPQKEVVSFGKWHRLTNN